MTYVSYLYLIVFLGGTFIVYTVMPRKLKWLVLLAASFIFYFLSSRVLTVFLLGACVCIYLCGLWLGSISQRYDAARKAAPKEGRKALRAAARRRKKAVITLGLCVLFGCLVLLKYYGFLRDNINGMFSFVHIPYGLPAFRFMLPMGISFYTLQAASYLIDVYRGKYPPDKNPARLCLFLCFFPAIVEGPIGRYDDLAHQLYKGHSFQPQALRFGLQRILWGLFKKVVIADRASILVTTVFDNYQDYSGLIIVIGVLFYTLQLYAEFSGCMDVVIGSAELFGIRMAENFKRPFFAKTVNDFWRRWHITLGAWLREYVFYSVSLSKAFKAINRAASKHCNQHLGQLIPTAFALFFVWFGNGIWHGASWRYILYGLYYYLLTLLGLLFVPTSQAFIKKTHLQTESKSYRLFQIARTFALVNLGMLLFRAHGVRAALQMALSAFTGFQLSALTDGSLLKLGCDIPDFIILFIGVTALFLVSLLQEKGHSIRAELAQKSLFIRWPVYIALLLAVLLFGAYGPNYTPVDLIYAQF